MYVRTCTVQCTCMQPSLGMRPLCRNSQNSGDLREKTKEIDEDRTAATLSCGGWSSEGATLWTWPTSLNVHSVAGIWCLPHSEGCRFEAKGGWAASSGECRWEVRVHKIGLTSVVHLSFIALIRESRLSDMRWRAAEWWASQVTTPSLMTQTRRASPHSYWWPHHLTSPTPPTRLSTRSTGSKRTLTLPAFHTFTNLDVILYLSSLLSFVSTCTDWSSLWDFYITTVVPSVWTFRLAVPLTSILSLPARVFLHVMRVCTSLLSHLVTKEFSGLSIHTNSWRTIQISQVYHLNIHTTILPVW